MPGTVVESPSVTSYQIGILAQTKYLMASVPNPIPPFHFPFVIESGKKLAGVAYTKGASMTLEADGHLDYVAIFVQRPNGALYTLTPGTLSSPRSGLKWTFTTDESDDFFTYFAVLKV